MREITEKQRSVLRFIKTYVTENTYPPTVREVSEHFQISLKAVQDHIAALRKKGYLSPSDKKSRSIKILIDDDEEKKLPTFQNIPLLGNVAAGKPIFCEENYEGMFPMPEPLIRSGKTYFALNVKGTSMIDAGILDGDVAIIEKCETAHNGQIVVAFIDDSVTLKRFFKEDLRVRLQPENKDFNPIYTTDVKILGVLSNIIRTY